MSVVSTCGNCYGLAGDFVEVKFQGRKSAGHRKVGLGTICKAIRLIDKGSVVCKLERSGGTNFLIGVEAPVSGSNTRVLEQAVGKPEARSEVKMINSNQASCCAIYTSWDKLLRRVVEVALLIVRFIDRSDVVVAQARIDRKSGRDLEVILNETAVCVLTIVVGF